eukprot:15469305-Alexandrium_andersonii.AAC.1
METALAEPSEKSGQVASQPEVPSRSSRDAYKLCADCFPGSCAKPARRIARALLPPRDRKAGECLLALQEIKLHVNGSAPKCSGAPPGSLERHGR